MKQRHGVRAQIVALVIWLAGCGGGGDSPPVQQPPVQQPPVEQPPEQQPPVECCGLGPSPGELGVFGATIHGIQGTIAADAVVVVSQFNGFYELWAVADASSAPGFQPVWFTYVVGRPGSTLTSFVYGYNCLSDCVSLSMDPAAPSISGTLVGATVSGGPMPDPSFVADAYASADTVTGAWTLQTGEGEMLGLDIDPTGNLTGALGNCTFTGKLAPSSSRVNIFKVNLNLAPQSASCVARLGPSDHNGYAWVYTTASGAKQMIVATRDSWEEFWLLLAAGTR
jgi:hypothetical protein